MTDDSPSIIFGRCPICARRHRAGWCATAITKFPAGYALTSEQVALIHHAAHGYIDEIWKMCRAHRNDLTFSCYRRPGEEKIKDDNILLQIARDRHSSCWLATVTSTKPDTAGKYHVIVDIYRPGTATGARH